MELLFGDNNLKNTKLEFTIVHVVSYDNKDLNNICLIKINLQFGFEFIISAGLCSPIAMLSSELSQG